MRKIFLALVLITGTISMVNAQDVITRKNGSEIRAKVVEVGLSEVKYKMYGNESGPTYTLPKAEIFMITYEGGSKDVFGNETPVSVPQGNVTGTRQQSGAAVRQPQEFDSRVRFGIKGGLNVSNLSLRSDGESGGQESIVGAVGGATLYAPFSINWGLHTGIEVSMKGAELDDGNTVRAIYLQAPVEVGYKIRFNTGWYLEPRIGLYIAYGIAGKIGDTDYGTFTEDVLKPLDIGFSSGFHFGNDKFEVGLHTDLGLTNIQGDRLGIAGDKTSASTSNIAIVAGFKF
jgi:hypothetical protein